MTMCQPAPHVGHAHTHYYTRETFQRLYNWQFCKGTCMSTNIIWSEVDLVLHFEVPLVLQISAIHLQSLKTQLMKAESYQ